MFKKYIIVLLAMLAIGCVSYDPVTVERIASRHRNDLVLNPMLCDHLFVAAHAFGQGEEKAWPFLGKAREIEDMHIILRKQGAACFEAGSRLLSAEQHDRVLKALKDTLSSAEKAVQ